MLTLAPYNNFKIDSSWGNFYYHKKVFDDQKIEALETMIKEKYTFSKGLVGSQELGTISDSKESNNRDIAYITPNLETKWIYDLLFPIALKANEEAFHFDIDTVTDPIHYVIYPEDGGHLDWHMDVGYGDVNKRKLALTVQLSDPSEYEGGEFEIWVGGSEGFVTLPREKGDVVVFPTFLLHRIKPITKGTRKCLVFWTGGRPFR